MRYIKTFEELNTSDIISIIRRYGTVAAKQMIGYHKDVNKRYHDNYTILMLASSDLNYFLVKDLISYNADLNLQNDSGETALIKACQRYSSSGNIGNQQKTVKELLEAGANPNIQDIELETPIQKLQASEYDTIKLLIEHGADLNIKNKYGKDFFENLKYRYDINGDYVNINSLKNKIQKDFPEKYEKYLVRKEMEDDVEKYNL